MVKANETNLEGILEGKRQYQVPLYQRVYSWGPKQIDQLWDDLIEIAEARRAGGAPTHFIGSLVLAASPDNGVVSSGSRPCRSCWPRSAIICQSPTARNTATGSMPSTS